MKQLPNCFLLLAVILWLKSSSAGAEVVGPNTSSQSITNQIMAELRSAYDYLAVLREQGRLPGESPKKHGILNGYFTGRVDANGIVYPLVQTFFFTNDAPVFTCYTVVQLSKRAPWQLQGVYQTDAQGKNPKEWPGGIEPRFFDCPPPPDSTPAEPAEVLKLFCPTNYQSIPDPLASTPEMKKWAQQATRNASNELDKAERLFYALPPHYNPGDFNYGYDERTAAETFEVMSDPEAAIICQDYAFLYAALARAAGLKAYYVLVSRNFQGDYVNHACAGVFINGKALLVDPTYHWFGVPHKKFSFETDRQALCLYACRTNGFDNLSNLVAIVPDWGVAHFRLAQSLLSQNEFDAARKELQKGMAINPEGWDSLYLQAEMEWHDRDWSRAQAHVTASLALMSNSVATASDKVSVLLLQARVLCDQSKLMEARDLYQALVKGGDDPKITAYAQSMIVYIDGLQAQSLYAEGKLKEARDLYQTLSQNKNDAEMASNAQVWVDFIDKKLISTPFHFTPNELKLEPPTH